MSTPKSTRVTKVQVPGEQPKNDKPAETSNATGVAGTVILDTSSHGAAIGVAGTNDVGGQLREFEAQRQIPDLDALRAQIRDEERANARAELGQHIQAASAAITASAAHSKADYRNMRAADIDPATLTAPVMTLDGYLCPPAPEKK